MQNNHYRRGCGELAEFSNRGMYVEVFQELVRPKRVPDGSGREA